MSHERPPEESSAGSLSRRTLLKAAATSLLAGAVTRAGAQERSASGPDRAPGARPWLSIRGIYGGFPDAILARGKTPADYGINAIWVGSGRLDAAEIDRYHDLGVKVFAEFNSMHAATFLKEHPDAAPLGPDGKPSPPPHGWQGVSPFHAGYRRNRMQEFRRVLATFGIDGIWLDYHHAHASWERDTPNLPDTDFSPAALRQFSKQTGITLPEAVPAAAQILLTEYREEWTDFRCGVFTDWVREYREVLDDVRPQALLGTFHCPWSTEDYDGAIRHKLAIDLPGQAPYLDIFSIMPYHARFGHAQDLDWISQQVAELGKRLKIEGQSDESNRIWPIVQLSDWGAPVPVNQVASVLEHGAQKPATGIMAFHWSGFSEDWDKVEALKHAYAAFRPSY